MAFSQHVSPSPPPTSTPGNHALLLLLPGRVLHSNERAAVALPLDCLGDLPACPQLPLFLHQQRGLDLQDGA